MQNHLGKKTQRQVFKTPTGIAGFDEITGGGLPKGRPSLLCGGTGSGKTLMAMEFIVKGITEFNENGVFISFEESTEEIFDNVASLGFDLDTLHGNHQIHVRSIALQTDDMIETGDYDLAGLFTQIGHAIDSINAKRVVIDGIETIFSCFTREYILRREFKRLFQWLKGKRVTAVITCERGDNISRITHHGIEEYLSDCVILLDQRIVDQISTRRLHILKYRGSEHGTNEYPFLITDRGILMFPITSMVLEYECTQERVSSGIGKLDGLLGDGKGYYQGSSILVSGTAGTGKSSFAASFARSVCASGNRCSYFAFEESGSQILRNMGAIGVDLTPFTQNGQLKIHAVRPTLQGLEMHLLAMSHTIDRDAPDAVIIDPITNMATIGNLMDIKLMFIRIMDQLKKKNITTLYTALTQGGHSPETTNVGISSVMDTWIILEHKLKKEQRQRSFHITKSRGMPHSRQSHLFEITDKGIEIA